MVPTGRLMFYFGLSKTKLVWFPNVQMAKLNIVRNIVNISIIEDETKFPQCFQIFVFSKAKSNYVAKHCEHCNTTPVHPVNRKSKSCASFTWR